ncbi:MAG: SUMF1/EgtB/PvdO family nonheme iron enzyme [Candidatus Eisenbacteria bacterium]|nr:SUMF1/EgtB/PvdO family nonheme iron enzyme [Candidatus Eisenbacteria bacterium]
MPPSMRTRIGRGNGRRTLILLIGVVSLAAFLAALVGCDEEAPSEIRVSDGIEECGALSIRADAGARQVVPPPEGPHAAYDPGLSRKKIPMSLVPAGSFVMGDTIAACGIDERVITLTRDYHLGRYEITNGQYRDALQWAYNAGLVTATSSTVKDNLDGSTVELLDLNDFDCRISFSDDVFTVDPGMKDHPVIEVSWYGAAAYCDWLSMREGKPRAYDHSTWLCNGGDPYGAVGYRLPTDAEWEYAARYDDERVYPWGDDSPVCELVNAFAGTFCVGATSPVGAYPSAPATLQLFDMAGNVMEWCGDWFVCSLGTDPETDPAGPAAGTSRLVRGGGWNSGADDLRCARRNLDDPQNTNGNVGFRIARTD